MYSIIIGVYVLLFVAEAIVLIAAWTQRRSWRPVLGAVIAVLAILMMMTPESTLANWVAKLPGSLALYVASAVFPHSKVGVVFYGILIVLVGVIGWTKPEPKEKKTVVHHKKRR